MERPFGYRGQRDTCKWCGRALRIQYITIREAHRPMYTPCCGSGYDPEQPAYCRCGEYVTPEWRRIDRQPLHDRPGFYGDGHFCSKGCGMQFGVAVAGHNIVLREDGHGNMGLGFGRTPRRDAAAGGQGGPGGPLARA